MYAIEFTRLLLGFYESTKARRSCLSTSPHFFQCTTIQRSLLFSQWYCPSRTMQYLKLSKKIINSTVLSYTLSFTQSLASQAPARMKIILNPQPTYKRFPDDSQAHEDAPPHPLNRPHRTSQRLVLGLQRADFSQLQHANLFEEC